MTDSKHTLKGTTSAPITRADVQSFGDAVDDHNPVHFDPEFARGAGLPDTIVHGPLTTAVVLDLIVAQLGTDQILNLDLRLRGPVFPEDSLTIKPIWFGKDDPGFEVHNQSGELVGTGMVVLKGGPDA
jgi:acyl dehydratase